MDICAISGSLHHGGYSQKHHQVVASPLSIPRIVEVNSRKFLGMFEMQSLENHDKLGKSIGLNKEGIWNSQMGPLTKVQYSKCAYGPYCESNPI